jgi:hypothetical protein
LARVKATAVVNSFVGGLNTQATGLNFPENSCTTESNCVFDDTGRVTRRKGYQFESGYSINALTKSNAAVVEYMWTGAGGNGAVVFAVQQIGNIIHFYRVLDASALSANKHATTINLDTYKIGGAPTVNNIAASFSAGKGYLFITHSYCKPFYVVYDLVGNTLAATAIDIKCRDFEGVNDALSPNERPVVLTDSHKYNLFNQGWADPKQTQTSAPAVEDLATDYQAWAGKYPSNSEQWFNYKDTQDRFDPREVDKFGEGNSLAPKGHYILDWFNTARATAAGTGAVTERSSSYLRPSSCAFFAGRVWYAGVPYNDYSGEIYFTQIIERKEQFGMCYQANDPTSEQLSDLLSSDGGIIKIPDIGYVYRLFPMQKAMLVFAGNGVWSISGPDTGGFKADDYTIRKLSSVNAFNSIGFIDVQGSPVWNNNDGIWTVTAENDNLAVSSLSETTVARFYKSIPDASKKFIKGSYDPLEKIIQWVYRTTAPTTVAEQYTYNAILNLNTKTGAFYNWTVASSNKTIHGLFPIILATYVAPTVGVEHRFRLCTMQLVSGTTFNTTFSIASNTTYTDWTSDAENLDYTSSFVTGFRLAGEGNKKFQSNYIDFYLEDETNSAANFRVIWDFNTTFPSAENTKIESIYLTGTSRAVRNRRVKIRGMGKALQFNIASVAGKPFNILGWSSSLSGAQDV